MHIYGGANNTLYKRDLKTGAGQLIYPQTGWLANFEKFGTAVHIDFTSTTKPPPTTKVYAFGGLRSQIKYDTLRVLDVTNLAAGWTTVTVGDVPRPTPRESPMLMRINEDTLVAVGGYRMIPNAST